MEDGLTLYQNAKTNERQLTKSWRHSNKWWC